DVGILDAEPGGVEVAGLAQGLPAFGVAVHAGRQCARSYGARALAGAGHGYAGSSEARPCWLHARLSRASPGCGGVMPVPAVTILEAIDHPGLWAPWFRDRATWAAWRAFLATLFGLPMSDDDLELYRQCTGRGAPPPGTGFTEAWLICGRRAGKSFILAL